MPYGEIDVSYRAPGHRIPVLINPHSWRDVQDILRDAKHKSVRFQLNVLGFIWFANADEAVHGDEFQGVLIVEKKNHLLKDAMLAARLVSGTLTETRKGWAVKLFASVHLGLIRDKKMHSERALLTAYMAWKSATDGAEIIWLDGLDLEEPLGLS